MTPSRYRVISAHRSEYTNPITFEAGTLLQLGERYDGPETGRTGISAVPTITPVAGYRCPFWNYWKTVMRERGSATRHGNWIPT